MSLHVVTKKHFFSDNKDITPSTRRAWFVVLVASLFFFYEFIQMNMFNAISSDLMQAFGLNAEQLSIMSSFYLLANVIFLFLAGMLLDRCDTRHVILVSLAICIVGTALLSTAHHVYFATICRFLTGIGSAFCFLSVIRLASRWFPADRMALVTGSVVMMAMLGGMASQTPFTLLAQTLGWRIALLLDAGLGCLIFIIIALCVKNHPHGHQAKHEAEQLELKSLGFFKSLKMAFSSLPNWIAAIYTCLMNLPIGILGGLWGILYLVKSEHFTTVHAADVTSMLFLGTVIGSPIVGWISDRLGRRKLPMVLGALITFIFMMLVLYGAALTFSEFLIVFFILGLVSSTQIISYALVAENSRRIITAMSVSVVNITVLSGLGLLQSFYGYLMDKHIAYRLGHVSVNFTGADFKWAMLIFPVAFILAIISTMLITETYCKPLEERAPISEQIEIKAKSALQQ